MFLMIILFTISVVMMLHAFGKLDEKEFSSVPGADE